MTSTAMLNYHHSPLKTICRVDNVTRALGRKSLVQRNLRENQCELSSKSSYLNAAKSLAAGTF